VPESSISQLVPPPVLFGRINVLTLEDGEPGDKQSLSLNWSRSSFGATVRATRYGSTLFPGSNATLDHRDSAAVLLDVEGRFNFGEHVRVSIGADNLLDEYPDPFVPALNTTGNAPFSNYSAFGRSGRFVYGRMSYLF
jgi:iron complex outermembrane receptor protein